MICGGLVVFVVCVVVVVSCIVFACMFVFLCCVGVLRVFCEGCILFGGGVVCLLICVHAIVRL